VSIQPVRTLLAFLLFLPLSLSAQDAPPDLLKIDHSLDSAIALHGLEGWMNFMSENTVLSMWEPLAPVAGREAIRKFMGDYFAIPGVTITFKPRAAHLSPSGQAGYTTGTYDWVVPNLVCHCTQEFRGKYIAVWSLGYDGHWKLKSFTVFDGWGHGCGCAQ
jgi:ketosteroid isomerase-like protein